MSAVMRTCETMPAEAPKILSRAAVVLLLKKKKGHRPLREFGREIGVSGSYLGDIFNGNRNPGEAVLHFLGLRRIVGYVRNR